MESQEGRSQHQGSCLTGLFPVRAWGRLTIHGSLWKGEERKEGKFRRKMGPGGAGRGMCMKLSYLKKPSTWVSVAVKGGAKPETVLWLEKGNSWGSADSVISTISADYTNYPPCRKRVLSSPPENQLLPLHPCTWLPTPLPGNNHQSWLCSICLTMRTSLGRVYPALQCPSLLHEHHMALNMFCITL